MRMINIKKEQILGVFYIIIIFVVAFAAFNNETVETFSMPTAKKIVVIDAGHGGWDPGKVGSGNTFEKDINLAVAKKLQSYLEIGGAVVVLTRADDNALANGKRQDMNRRRDLANKSSADILISIHQNSFQSASAKGAQVFYYGGSEKSKFLAECIQNELVGFLDTENHRVAKANKDYYVLRSTDIPAVIVECGFLSNESERKKLLEDEYQEKIAWSIYMGIIDFFNSGDE